MSDFLEAVVTMLPSEAGGRANPVSPREGSYRPFARFPGGGPLLRLRFIEGPPRLAPGDCGRVVLELETAGVDDELLVTGAELELVERGTSAVGLVTVARVWRDSVAMGTTAPG